MHVGWGYTLHEVMKPVPPGGPRRCLLILTKKFDGEVEFGRPLVNMR